MRLREFDEKERLEKANEKLKDYKTAAGADATAADAAGNLARGNTRFKGINRATKKQFANDAKLSQLKEFAPSDDGEGPDSDEVLRRIAAHWWNGTEQQMIRAEQTLAAMGWEIGQDESGDDDAGVFIVRAGDVNGNSYMAFPQSELNLDEEIDTDPAAIHGPSDPGDTEVAHAAELDVDNTLSAPQAPVATFEMADGAALECWGDDNSGYELRHGERALPSRFKNLDDAGMAVKLYQARRRAQQRDSNTDYIEER
jgi:hypothetical protein